VTAEIDAISEHTCFGGLVGYYSHQSEATKGRMKFGIFVPPQAADGPVPVLTWLAGLTCNQETFLIKSGALRMAAELGLMIVAPDTSPRGDKVPDDADGEWDFGLGAGFYLDATEKPWAKNYNMYSYVTRDLQQAVFDNFPGDAAHQGIFGHSMGGHGALTIGLKHHEIYKSISAFAPVAAPMDCPWGVKAFTNYLGTDKKTWEEYDASRLILQVTGAGIRHRILIDQGLDDQFLEEQLHLEKFQDAADKVGYHLDVRRHEGYDHGYFFISTFMADHLNHHALLLRPEQEATP
jgi:S-formylglutathione hydrolase